MGMETQLPSGTVTFLFTDVEGSTRLWAADTDAMAVSLRVHDAILRDAIESNGGYVFNTAGDSFAAAFSRASDAVVAAPFSATSPSRFGCSSSATPPSVPAGVRRRVVEPPCPSDAAARP